MNFKEHLWKTVWSQAASPVSSLLGACGSSSQPLCDPRAMLALPFPFQVERTP